MLSLSILKPTLLSKAEHMMCTCPQGAHLGSESPGAVSLALRRLSCDPFYSAPILFSTSVESQAWARAYPGLDPLSTSLPGLFRVTGLGAVAIRTPHSNVLGAGRATHCLDSQLAFGPLFPSLQTRVSQLSPFFSSALTSPLQPRLSLFFACSHRC